MKTSKLLITSLFAAAATLSVPAYADFVGNVDYTGGTDVAAGTTVGSYTLDEAISMGSTALDASLGSMQAGGNFYPSAYTLSFWVDISALPSSGNITLFTYGGTSPAGNDGSNALALNSDGTLTFGQGKTSGTSFEFRTDRQVTTTGNALTTNTVYHIALVNNGKDGDANTATLYINGTAVLNNVAVNLNMGGGTKSTVFSNLNLASASNISYGDAYLYNSALDASDVQKFTENYTITWNGGADGTWNSTATNWTHEGADVAFDNSGYDNVKFTSDAAVTVDEAVTVRNLYVTGGNVSFSGSSSILSTNGVTVSGSGVLSIDKYGDGSKSIIHGKLLIENGGKVKLTDGDATGYNGGSNAINTLVINEGGELIIETNSYAGTNQTFNMSGGITLQGGKISGTNADGYSKFDLFNSNTGITTLASSTTAEIQASIGLRLNGTFDVAAGTTADGVDLLVSGCLTSKAKFGNTSNNESFSTTLRKIGAGTMKLTGDNQYWTTGGTVEAGKLVAASANALGTGAITVNGDGSILDFSVAGGTFEQGSNQALTTTNGGKITVSAGTLALTGAVNLSNAIEVADGATVTTTRDVKFALGGLTGTAGESGTTFRLFTLAEGSSLTWAEGLGGANVNTSGTSVIGRGAGATFNANGTVTVSDGTAGDLIWVGDSAGAGTWNYATDNKPWTSGDVATSFMNKDNVTFAKNAAVTVDAAGICVGKMTIASGNTVTLTGGNLTVSDSIELGTGAMLSLGAGSANGATATLADNSVYAITASASGAVALDNVSGTGTLKFAGVGNLTDSGGSDPAFSTVAIGSGFTGTVEITAGLVDMLENADGASAILPSRLGSASKVVLNGGGLLFRNVNNTTQSDKGTFTTAIEVGAAGGVIRLYGNGNVTLASDISGAGTLKHTDGGTLTLAGTVNMTGGFSQVAGTTNFNDAATLGTLKVTGGTTTFAGATNITSATVTGGTLKFDFGALNDANTFSSASTLAVNGGTAIFGYGSGGGATITGDSFGQNLSIVVGSGARMTIAIAKNSMKAFAGNLTLKNGATYYKFDGGVELTGNVTLGEADSDLVYLLGNWGKLGTKISGSLSGAGTAYFGNEAYSDTTTEVLTISGSNNSYSGEIVVGRKNADTYSARNTELVLSTATALQNGKVNLAGSAAGNYAQLTLGANAITIAGLSGTEFGKVALGSGVSSSTLTLNQASDTTFSGTIADGIALKKAGAGTLTLSGDNSANTSGVTLSAGTLELGHNNALGGGALTIQGTPELKLGTDASGNALTVSNTLSLTSSVIVSSAHDGNELSGSISAFGQEIRKVGSGTLTLSGTNTEGSFFIVNVAEGKIIAGSDTALGATLAAEYAGFADYHKVRLSGGQLEVGSGVTLAQTNIEIALSSAYATTAAITGAADSALAADTVVTISSIDTADLAGVSLQTESAITRYDFKIADTLTDGLTEADFSLAQGLLDSGWDIAGYENGTLSLTLTVPEPSAFGLLAGAGALALVAARRRRTKKA